jgi:thiol-disulfide isomerase/thioredoxin
MYRICGLIILVYVLIGCSPTEAPSKPVVSGVFQDLEGRTVDLTELRGKWIVVNYWASWCKPCFMEIPELNKLSKTYKDKNVVVFGVSFDRFDSIDTLRPIVKKMGIQFPVLTTDPAAGLGISLPSVIPATYVINPKGEVQAELLGLQTQQSLANVIGE